MMRMRRIRRHFGIRVLYCRALCNSWVAKLGTLLRSLIFPSFVSKISRQLMCIYIHGLQTHTVCNFRWFCICRYIRVDQMMNYNNQIKIKNMIKLRSNKRREFRFYCRFAYLLLFCSLFIERDSSTRTDQASAGTCLEISCNIFEIFQQFFMIC